LGNEAGTVSNSQTLSYKKERNQDYFVTREIYLLTRGGLISVGRPPGIKACFQRLGMILPAND